MISRARAFYPQDLTDTSPPPMNWRSPSFGDDRIERRLVAADGTVFNGHLDRSVSPLASVHLHKQQVSDAGEKHEQNSINDLREWVNRQWPRNFLLASTCCCPFNLKAEG
jgi:hypothetical protein